MRVTRLVLVCRVHTGLRQWCSAEPVMARPRKSPCTAHGDVVEFQRGGGQTVFFDLIYFCSKDFIPLRFRALSDRIDLGRFASESPAPLLPLLRTIAPNRAAALQVQVLRRGGGDTDAGRGDEGRGGIGTAMILARFTNLVRGMRGTCATRFHCVSSFSQTLWRSAIL